MHLGCTPDQCSVLTFNTTNWHEANGISYDKFITSPDITAQRYAPVVDLRRGLTNQYGGNSYEVRNRNTYVEVGEYTKFNDGANPTASITTSGDVFIYPFVMTRVSGQNQHYDQTWHVYEYVSMIVESYMDPEKRADSSRSIWSNGVADLRATSLVDWYAYNTAYHQLPSATVFVPKPYNFQTIETYDTGIIASEFKNSG